MEYLKRTLLCKSRSEAHLINDLIVDDCNDAMRYYGDVFVVVGDFVVVDHVCHCNDSK